jgi:hypothetical protein
MWDSRPGTFEQLALPIIVGLAVILLSAADLKPSRLPAERGTCANATTAWDPPLAGNYYSVISGTNRKTSIAP